MNNGGMMKGICVGLMSGIAVGMIGEKMMDNTKIKKHMKILILIIKLILLMISLKAL